MNNSLEAISSIIAVVSVILIPLGLVWSILMFLLPFYVISINGKLKRIEDYVNRVAINTRPPHQAEERPTSKAG